MTCPSWEQLGCTHELRHLREIPVSFFPQESTGHGGDSSKDDDKDDRQSGVQDTVSFVVYATHTNRLPFDYLTFKTGCTQLYFADKHGRKGKPCEPEGIDTRTSWTGALSAQCEHVYLTGTPDPRLQSHANIACDMCYKHIQGVRWQCNECLDYDTCDECHGDRQRSIHHARHPSHTWTSFPVVLPFPSALLARTTIRTLLNIWQVYCDRPALALPRLPVSRYRYPLDPRRTTSAAEPDDSSSCVQDTVDGEGLCTTLQELYIFKTYADVMTDVLSLSRGLGTVMPEGKTACIVGRNSYQWIISDYAALFQGHVVIPIPFNATHDGIVDILSQAEPSVVFTSPSHYESIRQALPQVTALVSRTVHIVVMDSTEGLLLDVNSDDDDDDDDDDDGGGGGGIGGGSSHVWSEAIPAAGRDGNITIHHASTLSAQGVSLHTPLVELSPESLQTVVYTSGTTGGTKGVMFTSQELMNDLGEVSPSSYHNAIRRMVLYMPLSHQSSRDLIQRSWIKGGQLALASGNAGTIYDEMKAFEISWCGGVPRLWNALYNRYQEEIQRTVSSLDNTRSRREIEEDLLHEYSFALGPNCRVVTTGTAPISKEVKEWVGRCFYHCFFLEGYGATEIGAITHEDKPARNTGVKLDDVPEMGYLTTDQPYPRGEILARNTNMSQGYFRNPEATRERWTQDGWFRTGDIGVQVPDGHGGYYIRIIDRCKALFKLAQGEYVSPENVEGAMNSLPCIAQSMLHGNSLKSYPVALVVPVYSVLATALGCSEAQVASEEFQAKACSYLLHEIESECRKRKLPSYEIPRAVGMCHDLWNPDNGMLTASWKVNRGAIKRRYQKDLEDLYRNVDSDPGSDSVHKTLLGLLRRVLGSYNLDDDVGDGLDDNDDDDDDEKMRNKIQAIEDRLASLDSFDTVRLQSAIQKEFGQTIPLGVLLQSTDGFDSLRQLVENTQSQLIATSMCAREIECFDNGMEILVPVRCDPSSSRLHDGDDDDDDIDREGHRGFDSDLERELRKPLLAEDYCDWEAGFDNSDDDDVVASDGDVTSTLPRVTNAIFITGATGFIGVHLLAHLLRETERPVYCLVRVHPDTVTTISTDDKLPRTPGEDIHGGGRETLVTEPDNNGHDVAGGNATRAQVARERLLSVLQQYQLLDSLSAHALDHKLEVFAGDLAELSLGLTNDQCSRISDEVSTIYHIGAIVNWALPLSKMYHANVVGTQQVLGLATWGRTKVMNFVSTISVTGEGRDEDLMTAGMARHYTSQGMHGYAVSKWLAERLVHRCAVRNPGLDVRIFRPGMITADPATGACNPMDFVSRFVSSLLDSNLVFHANSDFEMIPVNYVASALAVIGQGNRMLWHNSGFTGLTLVQKDTPRTGAWTNTAAQEDALPVHMFNLTCPHPPMTYTDVANAILVTRPDTILVSYQEWRAKIEELPPGCTIHPMLPFFPADHPPQSRPRTWGTRYDKATDRALRALIKSGCSYCCPLPQHAWVVAMVQYIQHRTRAPAQSQPIDVGDT